MSAVPSRHIAIGIAQDNVGELRGTIATIILILAGLHASVGLIHHYLWQDGVLRRMLPGGN
jgi:superoxide oxidase